MVTLTSLYLHNPNNEYHIHLDSRDDVEAFKGLGYVKVHLDRSLPPLLSILEYHRSATRLLICRGDMLCRGDVSELFDAPLGEMVIGAPNLGHYMVDLKPEDAALMLYIDADYHTLNYKLSTPFSLDLLIVNVKELRLRIKAPIIELWDKRQERHYRPLTYFMNSLVKGFVVIPDSFYASDMWCEHKLVNPAVYFKTRDKLASATLASFKSNHLIWGHLSVYKPGYQILPILEYTNHVLRIKDNCDATWVDAVRATCGRCEVHRWK